MIVSSISYYRTCTVTHNKYPHPEASNDSGAAEDGEESDDEEDGNDDDDDEGGE